MSNWRTRNYTTFIGSEKTIDTIFSTIYEGNGAVDFGRLIPQPEMVSPISWYGFSVNVEYKTDTMLLISFDATWSKFFDALSTVFDDLTVLNLARRGDDANITERIGTKTANLCYW